MSSYEEATATARAKEAAENAKLARTVRNSIIGFALSVILVIGGCGVVKPQYTLYKANVTKETRVREAKAKRDAAVYLAQAEVERAKGVAASNEIIAASIDEQYLRYLYVQALEGNTNQIIYVPTEAGLPILEAGRGQG